MLEDRLARAGGIIVLGKKEKFLRMAGETRCGSGWFC